MDSLESSSTTSKEARDVRYSQERARLEAAVARAHRAVVDARNAADEMQDQGAELDLRQIEQELVRIAEQSLKGARRVRPMNGQLSIQA
jgi:hypothetical protein